MKIPNKSAVTELFAFYALTGKTKKTTVEGRGFYSLSYRYYGKVLLKTNDTELISEANSVTFMPRNINYETEIIEDTRMAVIHFKLDRDIDFRNPAVLNMSDKSVQVLFEKLLQSYRVGESVDFCCMANFYELLAKLESIELLELRNDIPRKIALARENMLRNFSDPFFSVTTLAESLGVSTSYLRREFSKAYGKSPIAFLKELRIGNAKNLLLSEYLSVAQIAEQSGFSSASYFIQVFHKTVGESPDRYRQRLYTK